MFFGILLLPEIITVPVITAAQRYTPIKITGKKPITHKYYLNFFSLLWMFNLKILTWILYGRNDILS